jgi:hypothetical protein
MKHSVFDAIPLWLVFVLTVAFVLLAVEIGFRAGIFHARKSEGAREISSDALVGSTLGLLAFILAFTFGMATSRYDTRRQLVLDDVIAIRTADLRAQQLPEPSQNEVRALLREYVDIRLGAALAPEKLPRALVRSEELQRQLWSRATTLGQQSPAIPTADAFARAIIQMIDVHSKRVTTVLQDRIPGTIWVVLYCLTGLAMAIAGYRDGIAGRRSMVATLVVVLAFSSVILLIADLDRPQEGFFKVSQDVMRELQAHLHHR